MHNGLKGWKLRLLYLGIFSLVMVILSFWIYNHWPDPPVNEIKAASEALTAARNAEALKYAPKQLQETCRLYDSAMHCWKLENSRFFLNRHYEKTRLFAYQAVESGNLAELKARKKASTVHNTTLGTIEELEKIEARFKKVYSSLPLQNSLRENFNRGLLLISEAKLAREKKDYHIAETKLERAGKLLIRTDQEARTLLEDYFSSYERWVSLVNDAIKKSLTGNSTVIIVDKMAHECRVYKKGQIEKSFKAEFGPNWLGAKSRKGDGATPEGVYFVVHKKERRKTIYHKALLLNYPNQDDKIRFEKYKKSGKIPKGSEIGGLIEIHGEGGKGFDWTNGCVALNNHDMDFLFKRVTDNTPVVIVGSVEPIEKYTRLEYEQNTGTEK